MRSSRPRPGIVDARRKLSPAAREALSLLLARYGTEGTARRLRSSPVTLSNAQGGLLQGVTAERLEERLAGLDELDVGGAR